MIDIRHTLASNRPVLVLFFWTTMLVNGLAASQLPKVWVDGSGGYAIGGFDPVDYFVKGVPVRPSAGVETYWGGASWKFSNVGNRAAFLSHPHIYVPRFGGVDPYLLTKRLEVIGKPMLFDIYEDRLYLFHSKLSLSHWQQHRASLLVKALNVWPKVAMTLGIDGAEITAPLPFEK